jgi:inner membrane protein
MPTLMTHAFVGAAAAATVSNGAMPVRFWVLSIFCSVLPDADVIGFALGIPYSHVIGHRGFFHSLSFSLVLGLLVVLVFFPDYRTLSRSWWLLLIFFFVLTASHGLLDAATNGGLGIALLSPYDNTRYFLSVTPIQVAPIGIKAFLTKRGVSVLLSEFVWVWIPCLAMILVARWVVRPLFFPRI